jgi:tetratricopeptide (TPR) repeat protein
VRKIFALLVFYPLLGCSFFRPDNKPSHARIAAQLREEKNYSESINEYHKHIKARLEDPRREPEENPYFYYILIGDVYLDKGDQARALESYLIAKQQSVEVPLIVDRLRKVASHLRKQGKLKEALELLKEYRGLDEFVFDLDIDEIFKELVKREDEIGDGR